MSNTQKSAVQIPTIRPDVALLGEDGNAMAIIARCLKAGRRAGWTTEQQTTFRKECTSGDYDHVLQTAMAWCNTSGSSGAFTWMATTTTKKGDSR